MKKKFLTWLLLLAIVFTILPGGSLAADDTSEPPATEEPSPSPNVSESPDVTESPEPSDPPEVTESPEVTDPPEPSDPPEETEPPEEPEPPATGMEAFIPAEDAPAPNFTDVSADSYYAPSVSLLYRLGIVLGTSETTFSPDMALTAAECAALSVRIYARYHALTPDLTPADGEPWYAPYLRAAVEYGIMPVGWNGETVLTRKQALYLMYRTLPTSELEPIRRCSRVPGLDPNDPQHDEILFLYEAGIVNGTDEYGTLAGGSHILRAQYIALLARLVDPGQRSATPLLRTTGMAAFNTGTAYGRHPFVDVPAGSYYDSSVSMLYSKGLINGTSATTYEPNLWVSRSQAVTLCVRVYELYHGLDCTPRVYDPEAYHALAREYGILPASWTNMNANVSRLQLAYLIAHTLPAKEFPAKKGDVTIPDVPANYPYAAEITLLYRAGILGGCDAQGNFLGTNALSRAELATVFARLVDPSQRLTVDLRPVETSIRNALKNYPGDWSVFVMDVASGMSISINPKRMWSASVVKLYVMGAVMEALENGTLANTKTIQDQLHAMITWSSNDAWKYLATQLGGGNYVNGMMMVNAWCDRNGYPNSGRRTATGNLNTTSAEDTGLFLQRILKGTNVSANSSAQMLSLLKQQTRTSKIPAGVPSGVVTANKTGELNTVQNDAAIIFAPYGTYILVVLTDGGYILHIRDLSTVVYNAMQAALA